MSGGSSFDPIALTEPRFPKSLYLIQPLFSAYELNPVALHAQESVPIPEGLDLDAWIVPPPPDSQASEYGNGPEERKVRKSKKGKGKEPNGKSKTGKHKHREDAENSTITHTLVQPEDETAEEMAEAEQVRQFYAVNT